MKLRDIIPSMTIETYHPDLELGRSFPVIEDINGTTPSPVSQNDAAVVSAAKVLKKEKDKEIDEEEDESINEKKLPAAWKRHTIVLSFAAGAVYFSTMPEQALISVVCALSFLKLSKSYMVGFPRFRRYVALSAVVGTTIAIKIFVKAVNTTPLAAALLIDTATLSAKSYMKGKLKKDEGPEETIPAFTKTRDAFLYIGKGIGSCASKVCSLASRIFRKPAN